MALIGFNWAIPGCFRRAQYGFLERGFPDDLDTYTRVAGMYGKIFRFDYWSLTLFAIEILCELNTIPL